MNQSQPQYNVWTMSDEFLSTLAPGTVVYAGSKDNTGIWCGIKKNGIKVVAWQGNIDNAKNPSDYIRALMSYSRG